MSKNARKRVIWRLKKVLGMIIKYIKKLDVLLLISVIATALLGVLLLYSMIVTDVTSYTSKKDMQIQFISIILGIIVVIIISLFDYRKIAKLWFLYVPAAVIPVLLTFTPLGVQARAGVDDTAWLDIGFMTVQPSEILKLAFILSFAFHINKVGEKINQPLNILFLCLHGAVPIGLVALQGDDGTAIVFAVIFVMMLFTSGISWKLVTLALIIAPLAIYGVWEFVLQEHQKNRFLVISDPSLDPNIRYHQDVSRIAIGSGQTYGKGLFSDDLLYVPEMHNDFIFSHLGQTLGFLGCLIFCCVIIIILSKILFNSILAKDKLGKQICIGVFSLLFVHYVINIGMVIGVMPVIGVPLPFVSAGGTAMVSMCGAIGLVISVYVNDEKSNSIFSS